ncbi:MAG TPA: tetratricopeptide repeat protein [Terracidiphilus sp.]|nr:tetratricopeptide repeat protein [Terracidiphilus sp.]
MESRVKAIQFGSIDRRSSRNLYAALGIIALFLSLTLLSGCFRDPNVRKHKYLESGQKYSAQGKDREAVIQYSNALKIDKNFAEAHYALAQSYLHLGALSAAYGELLRTVDLQPANYKARIDLGNMMLAGGRIDDAKAQADAVMAAQPDNADGHALLSRIAARRGDKDLALSEIRRALELSPNEAALHETLALFEVGDATKSASVEDELKKAVALDPKSVNAKLLLAAFYSKNNRWPEAEQTCLSAIATDPKNLTARESLAQIYLKQNNQPKAEETLRQASNDLADNPQGVRLLADYYTATGQIDKAKAEFAGLAKKYPKSLSVQEGYVRILLQVKDYATAQTVISELMKKNSKDPQVAVLNGIVLLNNGKVTDAVNALQSAANNAPKDAFIQLWLGRAALAKGDSGLAEKSFRQAVQLNPRFLEAQEELARMATQRGDMSLLSDVAEKTIATAPGFPGGYLWRAIVELSHNEQDKAEADMKTAISKAPQSAQAYLMLGDLRFAQKKYADGATYLEQALQYDPNSTSALRGLVGYDLYKKQPAQALARINAQIAKSPKNSGFYDLLAQLQIQNKNLDQAVAAAQKAMEVNPDDGEAVSIFAQLQVQRGQAANAIAAWEQYSKAHPNNANALAILGTLEETRGNGSKAEDYYKKALAIQPTQSVAANNLAYRMLQNGGNVDVALTLAQTARRGMPTSSSTADTLAWAYYQKGTYGFARDLLEEAIKTSPNNAAAQYHLGMVYAKLGDKTNAATHLKKAISLAPDSQEAKDAKTALQGLG